MVVILLLSNATGCEDYTVEDDDDDNNSTSTGITAIPTSTYFSQRYPYPNYITAPAKAPAAKYVKFKIDGDGGHGYESPPPPPRPPLPKEYRFYEPNTVPKPPRTNIFYNPFPSATVPTVPSATATTTTTRDFVRHVTRVNFFDSQVEYEGGEDGDTEAITKEGEFYLQLLFIFLIALFNCSKDKTRDDLSN